MSDNTMKPTVEEVELCEKLLLELCGEFDIKIIEKLSSRPLGGHLAVDSADEPEAEENFLRDIWKTAKDKLSGLVPVVLDFLRNLDSEDLLNAANILRSSSGSKKDIVVAILQFIADRLGKTAVGGKAEELKVAPPEENQPE